MNGCVYFCTDGDVVGMDFSILSILKAKPKIRSFSYKVVGFNNNRILLRVWNLISHGSHRDFKGSIENKTVHSRKIGTESNPFEKSIKSYLYTIRSFAEENSKVKIFRPYKTFAKTEKIHT